MVRILSSIVKILILSALLSLSACGGKVPAATPTTVPTLVPSETATEVIPPTETATTLPTETASPTAKPPKMLDDFGAPQTKWTAGTAEYFADSSAVSVTPVQEHATSGRGALQLTFEQNDKPKAIFFVDKNFDLSQAHYLQFDAFNDGSAASVGVAFLSGPDKIWTESDGIPVPSGEETTLSFDLTAATYKAASSNWEFSASIPNLESVSRIAIIVYPAKSGSIFIDTLRTTLTP